MASNDVVGYFSGEMGLFMKFTSRLNYAFYIMRHPFDGFWCLKTEGIGTIKSAFTLLAIFFVTMVIRLYTTSYIASSIDLIDFSIWTLLIIILGVFFLFCVSNWSMTTLMSGSGSFSNIIVATAYSLTPITLINIPLALLSQVITQEEMAFFTFFNVISIIYTAFLLLSANMTIHEYTMLKSILTAFITICVMVFIVVLGILFMNLVQQVWQLITSIYRELSFRF